MTPPAFFALVGGSAMAILLVTTLRVPFAGVRRLLRSGKYIAHEDEATGPWWVEEGGEPVDGVEYETLGEASRQLTTVERVRAWGGELVGCPWCTGGWLTGAAVGGYAAVVGDATALLWWLPCWFAAGLLAVVARVLTDLQH